AADSRRRPQLLRAPATLASDDITSDPKQPRHRLAATPAVRRSRLDRRDEDVRRQVGREGRIVDAPRPEPLDRLDVATVEALERIRIGRYLRERPCSCLSGHLPPPFSLSSTLRQSDAARYRTRTAPPRQPPSARCARLGASRSTRRSR